MSQNENRGPIDISTIKEWKGTRYYPPPTSIPIDKTDTTSSGEEARAQGMRIANVVKDGNNLSPMLKRHGVIACYNTAFCWSPPWVLAIALFFGQGKEAAKKINACADWFGSHETERGALNTLYLLNDPNSGDPAWARVLHDWNETHDL